MLDSTKMNLFLDRTAGLLFIKLLVFSDVISDRSKVELSSQ